jgi:hypothetical protein
MYGQPLRQLLALATLVLVASALPADADLLPADRSIPEVIDHYVDLKLKEAKITPASQADDHTLARRLYLDLAGRIPTAAEARAYAASTDPRKREKLIESLVASVEFVRHNATEFDELLRGENTDAASVRNYLLVAFQENRSWDRMFRELMGVQTDPAKPQLFVTKRLKDSDALTRDVSAIFFGLNISCAQCHRHPHVKALTQDYYYGLKAFFAQSYEIQDNLLERQFAAPVSFKTKTGDARTARLQFLNGKTAEPPEAPMDLNKAIQEESKRIAEFAKNYAKTKELPPAPEFSPRRELVELALASEGRDLFARSMVNRLWHRFYGYGLVMRVDQMHAKNEASHPQLLDWLSRDFIAHGYDLRRLIHGLVSTRTYARSSRWESGEPPAPELFAVAGIRPLSPLQWGVSQRLASNPAGLHGPAVGPPEAAEKQLEKLEVEAQKAFGQMIEPARDDLQIGVGESLKLSNDPAMLKLTGDALVPALLKLPDRKAQIDEAVWTVLSRPPTAAEHELLGAFLERRKDRPADALSQVVWALLNSPEFRFNH